MICAKIKKIQNRCTALAGGIQRIFAFDPADLDFTQAAADEIVGAKPYTAVALSDAADTAGETDAFRVFEFERGEAELTIKETVKGSFGKYEPQLQFKTAGLDMLNSNWNRFLDAIRGCCGLGLAVQLNTGKILILGEQIVNGLVIDIPLRLTKDGSSWTSGKVMDDFAGQDVILKGEHDRLPYEYTGGINSILGLAA